jgi:geranylgeranyl pyrophosphate synthase
MIEIETATHLLLEDLEVRLQAATEGDGVLYGAARYHLGTGGKRLRALLPPWLAENLAMERGRPLTTDERENALTLGVAFELLHNGTLVHDDLQDGDRQRRGQPTVWVRFGMPQAINVGTAMMLLGLARVFSSEVGPAVIADVNLALLGVIEGQAREFELHTSDNPTLTAWDLMAEGKTGALFGACIFGGARAAGCDVATADEAKAFGRTLGVCFQIQDDLLDLVGDKGREIPATDIAEGKVSWPVAWCAAHAEAAARQRLLAILRTPREATTRPMIDEALRILRETGALSACAVEIERRARGLLETRWSRLLPGLVERILAPIGHVVSLA